jgi:hypothetical protein
MDSGVWWDAAVDHDGESRHTSSWQETTEEKYTIRRIRATRGVLKHAPALNGGFRAIEAITRFSVLTRLGPEKMMSFTRT